MKSEADVKKFVKRVLSEVSGTLDERMWYFMPPANGYGRAGIPDFVGALCGMSFTIETKFGKNTLTPFQQREHAAATHAGVKCWIVSDRNTVEFEHDFRNWAQRVLSETCS